MQPFHDSIQVESTFGAKVAEGSQKRDFISKKNERLLVDSLVSKFRVLPLIEIKNDVLVDSLDQMNLFGSVLEKLSVLHPRWLPLIAVFTWLGASLEGSETLAFEANQRLGTGINLGNALESDPSWNWRLDLKKAYFSEIRGKGFDSVRIPVRWSTYASKDAPYTIDPAFFEKVDWAVNQALDQGLWVVLNMHHYLELFEEPEAHQERFLALWKQIADHYQDYPSRVFLEPLNEPNTKLTPDKWNAMIPEVLAVIRKTNPDRMVVIDVANWSNVEYTPQLVLPEEDRNLILSFHYYSPHSFTRIACSPHWCHPPASTRAGDTGRAGGA